MKTILSIIAVISLMFVSPEIYARTSHKKNHKPPTKNSLSHKKNKKADHAKKHGSNKKVAAVEKNKSKNKKRNIASVGKSHSKKSLKAKSKHKNKKKRSSDY